MCYDATTSITTFGFVSILSAYLWYRNGAQDRASSLILFFITLMQLVEFVLWTHLGENSVNQAVSSLIPILLWSQPLFVAFIMWSFKAGWYTDAYKYIFYSMTALLPVWVVTVTSTIKTPYTTVGSSGHLVWPYSTNDNSIFQTLLLGIYFAALFFLCATFKKLSIGIGLTAGYLISLLYYYYYYNRDVSTIWCHAVNIVAIIALL